MGGFENPGFLLQLLDATDDQLYAIDLDAGRILDCNEGACRALGYTREEILGLSLWEMDANLPQDAGLREIREFYGDPGEPMTFRTRHRRKDGTTFPVEVRARTHLIDGRHIQVGIARDITGQREVERELDSSRRQLEVLVRSLPGVVYRYELSTPVRVLWLDDRVEDLLGYPAEEFISGRRTIASVIAPEDVDRVTSTLHRLAEAGGGATDLSYQLIDAEGERKTVRDSATVTPPRESGQHATVEGITFDVSDRVARERALREAWLSEHERYEFVVAASGQIIYEWDIRAENITWGGNLEEVFGYTELQHHFTIEDALARVHPEDRERVRAATELSASTLGRRQMEYRLAHADGTYRWVWDHAINVRDASGRLVKVTGVLQDITERKRLEAQIASAQRMETIGALAGGVAHDVNNYLTTILGNVDVALMRLKDPDAWPELEDARKAAAGCAELVRSLLTFARQEDPVRSRLELGQVVMDSLRMLRPLVGPAVEVTTEISGSCPSIDADRVQLQQVIMNLVANARDAMDAQGRITIGTGGVTATHPETGVSGRYAQLWVRDTGPGVPVEIRERIFEPYFTTRAAGVGTGLGLSIVHGIAASHGGWAQLSSTKSGARIAVFFPAA